MRGGGCLGEAMAASLYGTQLFGDHTHNRDNVQIFRAENIMYGLNAKTWGERGGRWQRRKTRSFNKEADKITIDNQDKLMDEVTQNHTYVQKTVVGRLPETR